MEAVDYSRLKEDWSAFYSLFTNVRPSPWRS